MSLLFEHCDQVAQLHLASLQTHFSGRAGIRLLGNYYAAVTRVQGACGYVAEESGVVAGFVCGVWAPQDLRRALLRERALRLAFWAGVQVLLDPQFAVAASRRCHGQWTFLDGHPSRSGYELRPIVVQPSFRGCGVARQLVAALLADAASRGFNSIYLLTEENNHAANRLYQGLGFTRTARLQRDGQPYSQYERSIGQIR